MKKFIIGLMMVIFCYSLYSSTSVVIDGVRYFDITIAYEGGHTEEAEKKLESVLSHFAYGIYQCSQGKHKLRSVSVYTGEERDRYIRRCNRSPDIIWTTREESRLHPHVRGSGVAGDDYVEVKSGGDVSFSERKESIMFCDAPLSESGKSFAFDLRNKGWEHEYYARIAGATLTHEWGHYHYGVFDEYLTEAEFAVNHINNKSYGMVDSGHYEIPYDFCSENIFSTEDGLNMHRQLAFWLYSYNALMCSGNNIYGFKWKTYFGQYLWDDYIVPAVDVRLPNNLDSRDQNYYSLCFSLKDKILLREKDAPWDSTFYDETYEYVTKQYRKRGMPSWAYVVNGGYKFKNDFNEYARRPINKLSDFKRMSFADALPIQIQWNPVSLVVCLIDNSGSMDSDSRMENAAYAAVELLNRVPNGEQFLVYKFNNSASLVAESIGLDDTSRSSVATAIKSIRASGGTYIGKATGTAIERIKSQLAEGNVADSKVFLLSDGESSDSALKYVEELKRLNIPVYTFGYGTASSGDLSTLASRTGGKYYYAPSGVAIQKAFQEAGTMFGSRNQGSSGVIGNSKESDDVTDSGTQEFSQSFFVDSSITNLKLTVSYKKGTPLVLVEDATNAIIQATEVINTASEVAAIYDVANPSLGEWRIFGTKLCNSDIAYFYDSTAVLNGFYLSGKSEKVSVSVDGHLVYRVELLLSKEAAINGADIVGVLYKDGKEVDSVRFDNSGDGKYTAYITIADDPKIYSLSVTASNESGNAYETFKEFLYEGRSPPDDRPIKENFERTVSVTFLADDGFQKDVLYVDASRSNDTGDGRTWATAKKTIQSAIAAIATNGTIVVTNGVYDSIVTRGKPLTIKSVNGWRYTVIDGGNSVRCVDSGGTNDCTSCKVIGFRLINGNAGDGEGGGARGVSLARCRIENCQARVGGGVYYGLLEGCIVASNIVDVTGGGAQDCALRSCTVVANAIKSSLDSQGAGVYKCGVYNSIVWDNCNATGKVDNCAASSFLHSCVYPIQEGKGNVADDPALVSSKTGDYRLQSISPCRDVGHIGYIDEGLDIDGAPRVMGSELDIGALEYGELPSPPIGVNASDGLSTQYVSVAWTACQDAKTYSVWRKNGDDLVCLTNELADTFYLDFSAVADERYEYFVKAVNSIGEGPLSEPDEGWISVDLFERYTPVSMFEWNVENNEVTITKYIGTDAVVNIPSAIEGMSVVGIGAGSFANCNFITSVTIPDSVISVGERAFRGCDLLKSVYITNLTRWCSIFFESEDSNPLCNGGDLYLNGALVSDLIIPDGIKCVDWYSFYGCSSLKSVMIPDSVTTIEQSAFEHCSSLERVTIGDGVVSIERSAFMYCDSLVEVIIGGRVQSIGPYSFSYCNKLSEVVIPDSVISIGESAFSYCSSLSIVKMPNSVMEIGSNAFYHCYLIESVYITDIAKWCAIYFRNSHANPLQYGASLYLNGIKVSDLVVPEGVASIENYAFCGYSSLTSVTIPNGVTSIGWHAFSSCSSLTSITIPDSVTSIGGWAFSSCNSLLKFNVASGNSQYKSINGMLLSKDGKTLVSGVNGNIVIPDGVLNIDEGAFSGRVSLMSVYIPSSVKSIGRSAFYGCRALAEFNVSNANSTYKAVDGSLLSKDGHSLIYAVGKAGSVIIPSGVKYVKEQAMSTVKPLLNLTIPPSVLEIGEEVFTNVDADRDFNRNVYISNMSSWCKIKYPTGYSHPMYSAAYTNSNAGGVLYNYGECVNKLIIPDDVYDIRKFAFFACKSISEVEIHNSVSNIGYSAFAACSQLKNAKIGDGVESIYDTAFFGCSSLTNIALGKGLRRIRSGAFRSCSGLESIVIPESVTNIASWAFRDCTSLSNVIFEGDAPSLGPSVFTNVAENCTAYVHRGSTGWGVEIPGKWHGIDIAYIEDDGGNVSGQNFEWIVTNNEVTITKYIGTNTVVEVPAEINGYPVTAIGAEAFFECGFLMDVILPNGLKVIGERAFAFCGLVEVSIPEGVTDIGDRAFWTCDLLKKVSIPNSVTNIGQRAFCWCESLEEVVVPESVASIGDRAFAFCHSMTNITFLGDSPVMGEDVFGAEDEVEDMICTAYVRWNSIGWGVEIPGIWNGIGIEYLAPEIHTVIFDLGGNGTRIGGGELVQTVTNGCSALEPVIVVNDGRRFMGWEPDISMPVTNDVTFMAQYAGSVVIVDSAGSIRSIDPCDQYGYAIGPGSISNSYAVGQTAYFRIRLENVNSRESWECRNGTVLSNPWMFEYLGPAVDMWTQWRMSPPKIGVYVNGRLRPATVFSPIVPEDKGWYTDIICSYTVEPGDLALPLTLADSFGNEISAGSGEYYLDTMPKSSAWKLVSYERESAENWNVVIRKHVCSFKYGESETFGRDMASMMEMQDWTVDYTFERAGIYIKGIDFTLPEYSVIEGCVEPIELNLQGGVNTNRESFVYVKIKDGGAVSLAEDNVERIEVEEFGSTVVYQVARVAIPFGDESNVFFIKIRGVTPNASETIYVSTEKSFSYNIMGERVENYFSAVIRCLEPLKFVSAVIEDADANCEYDETAGEISIRFKLSHGYDDNIYAFLLPNDVASSNSVRCSAFDNGVPILCGDTESISSVHMQLLDGTDISHPLVYGVVLRTARTWDAGETIHTYESTNLEVVINNVEPEVVKVNMSGSMPVNVNGGTFSGSVIAGTGKIFTLDAKDVEADLTNNVKSVWSFTDENGYIVHKTVIAPVDDIVVTNEFPLSGTYTCTVKLQDKDMSSEEYGMPFSFNVVVVEPPFVGIAFPDSNPNYKEKDIERGLGYFFINLSLPASSTIDVAIECVSDGVDGVFNIATNIVCFRPGQIQQRIEISELDGTASSASIRGGFKITAQVISQEVNQDGVPLNKLYVPASAKAYVINEPPEIIAPHLTNQLNKAVVNVPMPIEWKINDVDNDRTNLLTVAWITSEGARYEYSGTNVYKGIHNVVFSSSGLKTVTVNVFDKDGAMSSAVLNYEVEDEQSNYNDLFEWDVTMCGVEITRYIGTATQVNIPSSIDNLPVVAVGAMAFMDCTDVESVVIPDTVQEINVAAFAYCTSLKSVTISKRVSYIDSEAFDYCCSLESFIVSEDNDCYKSENNLLLTKDGKTLVCGVNGDVEIPYGVETIEYSAFYGMTNLSSVTISDTVSVIMEDAFGDCLSLEHIELPFSVTNIETYAFSGSGIKSFYVDLDNPVYKSDSDLLLSKDCKVVISGINRDVEIPAGVIEISEGAFCGLAEVSGVQLPDSMESIGCFAFEWCSSLVTLTIPENVSSIGERAFAGCSSLTNATFLGNAPEMGVNVFQDYNNSICGDAFLDCTAYVRRGSAGWGVDIPGVWQGIRIEYFEGFADLDDGKDEVNGYVWFYQDLAQGGGIEIIGVDPEPEGDITIPEILDGKNVVGIGEGTFAYCDNLWLVDIPASVRNIGDEAFYCCDVMEAIFFPNMLTNIGQRAFYGCNTIEYAHIPFGVRKIGDEAFSNCLCLERISVPSSVSSMGVGIFAYCDNLADVDLADGLQCIGSRMFYGCAKVRTLSIPEGCWNIKDQAFAMCENLLMVSIPNSVTRLGDPICCIGAIFAGCDRLETVVFSERTNALHIEPCEMPEQTSVVVNREGYGFVNWRDAYKDGWAPVDDPFRMKDSVSVVPVWSSINEPGLEWETRRDSAVAKAISENKKILLVAGRGRSLNTLYVKNSLCMDSMVYERLVHDFVLWYCDIDINGEEIDDYVHDAILPLVCILDPEDMSNAVGMLSGWTDHDRFVEFLDEYGLWNPVDDVVLPEGYNVYDDGRYIWLWERCDDGAALIGYYSGVTNDSGNVYLQLNSGVFPEPTGHVDVPEYVYLSGAGGACDDGASAIPVVALDNGIFCNCTNMTSVTLPDTLRWIGCSVFDNTGITSLLLPDGLREIVCYAFANSSLEEINVPGSLEFVDYGVFSGTPWLEAQGDFAVYGDFLVAYQGDAVDVEIPDSVRAVCEDAFNSSAVESVHISDSVKFIDEYAFYCAENLIEVTGGNNVEYVGYDAFGDTGIWEETPEGSLVRVGNMIVGYKGDLPESLEIPEGVTIIGEGALSACTNITSLTLPATLMYINDWAFEDCSKLEDVVFKGGRDNVTMDISSAFHGTPWLENKAFDPPENDNIADALLLVGTSGRIEATNLGATSEDGENDFGHGKATVWWKWRADDNVRMTFDTFGSNIDSVLGIYVYEAGSLVEIVYNDDCDETDGCQSRVSFDAEGDVTYYIAVSGYDSEMGDIVLNWNILSDVIPELGESATAEQVAAALEGSADAKLVENIKTVAEYAAFREWALNLEGITPEEVKASPNAWLSYALDTDALIAAAPKEGDVVIDTFEIAATEGAFEFTVKIDGVEVGDNALEANLQKVFDIEGTETLASGGAGFSSDNVEVNTTAPENGSVKFTVTPKAENGEWGMGNGGKPNSFFFRVKMK